MSPEPAGSKGHDERSRAGQTQVQAAPGLHADQHMASKVPMPCKLCQGTFKTRAYFVQRNGINYPSKNTLTTLTATNYL